ncbi:MAG: hypothetical protein Q8S52_03015, partial [Methylobacter sp.]|nr:hypothetical protein [Methylobacter sp.]
MTVANQSCVKVIGANGQISLGKQYAGLQVLVEEQEPGVWRVRTATIIPDNEHWLHQAKTADDLKNALSWVKANPVMKASYALFKPPAPLSNNDLLLIALFISAIIHVFIGLGIHFTASKPEKISRSIDVNLVTTPDEKAPEKAQSLAQENQQAAEEQKLKAAEAAEAAEEAKADAKRVEVAKAAAQAKAEAKKAEAAKAKAEAAAQAKTEAKQAEAAKAKAEAAAQAKAEAKQAEAAKAKAEAAAQAKAEAKQAEAAKAKAEAAAQAKTEAKQAEAAKAKAE